MKMIKKYAENGVTVIAKIADDDTLTRNGLVDLGWTVVDQDAPDEANGRYRFKKCRDVLYLVK